MSCTICPSYNGKWKCICKESQVCSHHGGNYRCKVNGDLSASATVKTKLEKLEEKGIEFTQKMNGIGSL